MAGPSENELHTITSSLPLSRFAGTLTVGEERQRVQTISTLLARLAIHYYRPDFTEQHAKLLIQDYVSDLAGLPVADIEVAIRDYRQRPAAPGKPKYFPDSAELRALAISAAKERFQMSKPLRALPDSRPAFWWMQSRERWKPHWRESEIPADETAHYRKWLVNQRERTRNETPSQGYLGQHSPVDIRRGLE